MNAKYVFVSGGVASSLGKGIISASLAKLLQARGLRVTIQKFDPYINIDPGTLNPYEHGECYVTEDGAETDLDLGHYERFIDENLNRFSNLTTGKVYWNVLNKERAGRGLIVEAERTLNTMNIFSADGTYARTVCIFGDRVDDVSSAEHDSDARLALRPKTFPDFVSVLHWYREPEVKQYVRLFSYDGEPLAEISLPRGAIFYDFDIPGCCLYVLVSDQEFLIRYDISELLNGIIPAPAR